MRAQRQAEPLQGFRAPRSPVAAAAALNRPAAVAWRHWAARWPNRRRSRPALPASSCPSAPARPACPLSITFGPRAYSVATEGAGRLVRPLSVVNCGQPPVDGMQANGCCRGGCDAQRSLDEISEQGSECGRAARPGRQVAWSSGRERHTQKVLQHLATAIAASSNQHKSRAHAISMPSTGCRQQCTYSRRACPNKQRHASIACTTARSTRARYLPRPILAAPAACA